MKRSRALIFLICCSLVTSCSKNEEAKSQGAPIKIGTVTVEDIPHFIKGVGQLFPSIRVDLKAQVSGTITNILFTDGQRVNEGDLLMTIDPRIYEASKAQAYAQLAEDEAKLRYARELADTYGKLVAQSYVSRLNYEEAVQNVKGYTAAVELDLATIKKAEVNLSFTKLTAPFSGYLGLRTFDPGNYVDATQDTTLVTLNKVTPLTVRFYLPAEFTQEIRERQATTPLYLEAILANEPQNPLQGSLWFIDNRANAETGMIMLEGTIPNEDERGWPGQFVRVFLRLKTLNNAILVPRSAVVLGEHGSFVYVLDEQKMRVNMRMIGKGFVYKDSYVVTWGVCQGEKVVVDGQVNLYENALVYIPEAK